MEAHDQGRQMRREGCSQAKGTACAKAWVSQRTIRTVCNWEENNLKNSKSPAGEEGRTNPSYPGRLDGWAVGEAHFLSRHQPGEQTSLVPMSYSLSPPAVHSQLEFCTGSSSLCDYTKFHLKPAAAFHPSQAFSDATGLCLSWEVHEG